MSNRDPAQFNRDLDWVRLTANSQRMSQIPALGVTTRRVKWDMNAAATGKLISRGRMQLLAAYIVPRDVPPPGPIFVQFFDTNALVSGLDDAVMSDVLPSGEQPAAGTPLMNVPVLSIRVDLGGAVAVWESPAAEKGIVMGFDSALTIGISTNSTNFVAAAPGVVTPVVGTFVLRHEGDRECR